MIEKGCNMTAAVLLVDDGSQLPSNSTLVNPHGHAGSWNNPQAKAARKEVQAKYSPDTLNLRPPEVSVRYTRLLRASIYADLSCQVMKMSAVAEYCLREQSQVPRTRKSRPLEQSLITTEPLPF